ncbi:Hypothetical predicted protein [Octopus vulgaris]|uniref:Uncharacterized protein n=1 Tax=Octopus vulgaris TaxID=6645 RepID=A0AA36BIF4_OCTVU|nr:Hypothetical predicted protein [Octopus vulgaris]
MLVIEVKIASLRSLENQFCVFQLSSLHLSYFVNMFENGKKIKTPRKILLSKEICPDFMLELCSISVFFSSSQQICDFDAADIHRVLVDALEETHTGKEI